MLRAIEVFSWGSILAVFPSQFLATDFTYVSNISPAGTLSGFIPRLPGKLQPDNPSFGSLEG